MTKSLTCSFEKALNNLNIEKIIEVMKKTDNKWHFKNSNDRIPSENEIENKLKDMFKSFNGKDDIWNIQSDGFTLAINRYSDIWNVMISYGEISYC